MSVDPCCPRCRAVLPPRAARCSDCGASVAAEEGLTPPSPTVFTGPASSLGDRRNPDESDELVGEQLGVYRIERFAGRGGMARVYRARHTSLERRCALKVLNQDLVIRHPDHVEQFFTEARAAAGLVHPNVVTVHNLLEERGLHAIEMEWVGGSSLKEELLEFGRLEPLVVVELMAQACAGLAEAHRNRIIHRDLKPSNMLLKRRLANRAGRGSGELSCKLADFGLAKRLLSPSPAGPQLAGTPQFMAPEVFRGGLATPRTDVYAAGVTLFLLLTGEYPFPGESLPELVRMHREGEPVNVRAVTPQVPEALATVIDRCLARRENARFENGEELAEELRLVLRSLRPLIALFRRAVRGLAVDARQESQEAIEAAVTLPHGRRQRVRIEIVEGLSGESLIRLSSPCAPVADSYLRRALELNSRVDHGAIAIEPLDGQSYFVMRNAYPRATCDPEELRETLLSVARAADAVEKLLLGSDTH